MASRDSRKYIMDKRKRLRRKKLINKIMKYIILILIVVLFIGVGSKAIKYYAAKNNVAEAVQENILLNTKQQEINEADENNIDYASKDREHEVDVIEEEKNGEELENKEEVKESDKLVEDINNSSNTLEGQVVDNASNISFEDYADDSKEIEKRLSSWNFLREDGKKIAYLTFDDGPSTEVTPQILDVLKRNNVKATFFVLGSSVEKSEENKELLKRIQKEGHAIGNHGYSHRYDILYPNGVVDTQAFTNDMKKSESIMKSVLGEDFHTRVIRFPGGHGSWNTSNIDTVLEQNGYTYIDWNTLSGDAEGSNKSTEELKARLRQTVSDIDGNNDVIVILMHDKEGKDSTAESLEYNINYLKSLGYEFRTLK